MLKQALQNTLTFVLAGGQGNRLKSLTQRRAKPAVPFGGSYRIIDFTLSNCLHSGLRRIYVLTQYQARSLEEHVRFAWNFLPRRLRQFIGVRPPHHEATSRWYAGTADAIFQNIDGIKEERPDHVLVLSGDHIYKMDYGQMIETHIERGAGCTIGAVRIPQAESKRFGILEAAADGRVTSFVEKPDDGPELPGSPGYCLGSMGIYVFNTDELIQRLVADAKDEASSHDFGNDVIPKMIPEVPVYAHEFVEPSGRTPPYWRDVGTIESYYDANMDLCSAQPQFNLYDESWPIYTLWHNDPPAKTGSGSEVVDSMLSPGVIVSGARVAHSILGNRAQVGPGAVVDGSMLFRGVEVGAGAVVRRAIVDKWTKIPDGEQIGVELDRDRERFVVSETGIVLVPRNYRFE